MHILAHPLFSRIYGVLTRIRSPKFLVRFVITRFAAHYRIKLEQFVGPKEKYISLADFFVRPLNPQTRPLDVDPTCIQSPCDGIVADIQSVDQNLAVQAKGKTYRIADLLGRELEWSREWWLCTLYLSPADYHRFHYPWSGSLREIRQLGNRLYPVNHHGVNAIPRLFVRNERLVLEFDLEGIPAYAVAVGATFVGSVALCALDNKTLPRGSVTMDQVIRQTEEMGRFNLGSTIILLFPKAAASPQISRGDTVSTGQALFRFRP